MYKAIGKRLFDAFFSFTGLVFLSPFFLLIPIFIKIDSAGAVFFIQKRMGRQGRLFSLLKFRTMSVDPDKEKAGFEPGSARRITRIGQLLRKTKLDEIPQLVNVLKGDMSFVGPRPEVERYKDFYVGEYMDVLSVAPGITDEASIKYRHEEQLLSDSSDPEKTYKEIILPDKLRIALVYVRGGITLEGDLGIIMNTLVAVFQGKR